MQKLINRILTLILKHKKTNTDNGVMLDGELIKPEDPLYTCALSVLGARRVHK